MRTQVTLNVKLKPFNTPNFVILDNERIGKKQDGISFDNSGSLPLSEIDEQILSQLCDNFRCDVFNKAGKLDPRLVQKK